MSGKGRSEADAAANANSLKSFSNPPYSNSALRSPGCTALAAASGAFAILLCLCGGSLSIIPESAYSSAAFPRSACPEARIAGGIQRSLGISSPSLRSRT